MAFSPKHARHGQFVLAGFGVIAAALFAAPAAADVKTGVDAWSAGDYGRAVAEWRDPAAQGDTDALFNLAQAYRLGRGVPADVTRARELYLQAAQQGHVKAADNYGLLLFQQGEQRAAMPLIEAAAERGDPRAQYVVGLAHFNADYAEKDWVRAYALLSLSQASGLPQATKALGQMDQYIPIEQRQEAQVLAQTLKAEADQRLTARLAAADLGVSDLGEVPAAAEPARAPSVSARVPIRTAAAAPAAEAPAPQSGPRGLPAAPQPVAQYRLPSARSSQIAPVPQANASAPYRSAPVAPATSPDARTTAPLASGNWGLQLGAFGVSANADKLWAKLAPNPALSGTRKSLVTSGRVTRLLAVGFSSQSAAAQACSALKQQGQDCIVKKT